MINDAVRPDRSVCSGTCVFLFSGAGQARRAMRSGAPS